MKDKDVDFINENVGATSDKLTFDAVTGFAVSPSTGGAWFSADFRDIVLTIVGTGTVIVYGSAQRLPPDFTSASTITNSYVPIALVDYSLVGSSAYYAGTTGAVVSNATMLVECDTNLLTWFAIHRSVDTVNVLATVTNAQ